MNGDAPGYPLWVAALTPAQKTWMSGEGSGDVAARWVNRIAVASRSRLERQVVPVPPSHPMPHGNGRFDEPLAGTAIPGPHPPSSPRKRVEASRWNGVSRSVVISATAAGDRIRCPRRAPPASNMKTNDQ
jgi:hypothetical protein